MAYLLSCPGCHRQLEVSTGQSGQSLTCACGNRIDVPTLRDLMGLPRADAPAPAAASAWSVGHGIVLLGVLVAVAAGAFSLYLKFRSPAELVTIEAQDFDRYSPAQAWDAWDKLKLGIDVPVLEGQRAVEYQKAIDADRRLQRWEMVAYVLTAVGLLMTGWGIYLIFNQRAARGPRGKGRPT